MTTDNNWTKIAPGTIIPFPALLYCEKTGHIHLWRSEREMVSWQLYTHFMPQDNGPIPAPPSHVLAQNKKDGSDSNDKIL